MRSWPEVAFSLLLAGRSHHLQCAGFSQAGEGQCFLVWSWRFLRVCIFYWHWSSLRGTMRKLSNWSIDTDAQVHPCAWRRPVCAGHFQR
jgi:hypothetical protein